MAGNRGVNLRIRDATTPKPEIDAAPRRALIGQDKRNLRPVGRRLRRLAAHRTGQRRGDQHQRNEAQRRKVDAGGQRLGPPGDGQIRLAGLHHLNGVGGVAGGQLDLYLRMLGAEAIQNRRQMAVGGGHRAEQA